MPSDDYRTYGDAVNARDRGLGTGFDGILFIFSPSVLYGELKKKRDRPNVAAKIKRFAHVRTPSFRCDGDHATNSRFQ